MKKTSYTIFNVTKEDANSKEAALISQEFGGTLFSNSNPKTARPVSTTKPMYMIMYSTMATDKVPFNSSEIKKKVEEIIENQADTFKINVLEMSVEPNYIQMAFKVGKRENLSNFIRCSTGLIAKASLQGDLLKKTNQFWDYRPYTCVLKKYEKGITKNKALLKQFAKKGMM